MTQKASGAVLYTRVSTDDQDRNGTSPETQRDACRAKALSLGLPITAEYHDGGVSGGFLLTRAGMQAALSDLQAGRADTLICANLSRYSRDVEHQQAIKKAVRAAGGRLVFCDMDFDDSPEGDLAFNIMGGFAEYEKAVIKKRTNAGRERRAREGVQTARTYSPFGYRIVTKADVLRGDFPAGLCGRYVVIEAEAAIVREMFARYASGAAGLTALARWLNASGVPTRQGAAYWHSSTVSCILRNPVYKGVGVYGRTDARQDESRLGRRDTRNGRPYRTAEVIRPADPETWITWPVPPLVSEEEWDAARARATGNQKTKGGNPRRVRMLAGRVFCLHCRGNIQQAVTDHRNGKDRSQYICWRNHHTRQNKGEGVCVPTRYSVVTTERSVVEAIIDGLQRPETVAEVLRAAEAAYSEEGGGEDTGAGLVAVEAALVDLEAKQAAAVKAQIAGIMAGAPPQAYDAVFEEIASQRTALDGRKASLERNRPARQASRRGWTGADFACVLADVRRVLTSPETPGDVKREAVGMLVERVYPLEGGAKVVFRSDAFGASETIQQISV